MLLTLATADAIVWTSIFVKALTYAATLVAAGSVLIHVSLRTLDADTKAFLVRVATLSAITAAALSVVRLPVRASFLMGGGLDGAIDPMLLGMVADSPLGTSIMLRLFGLALILAIHFRGRGALWIASMGAVMVAGSFAFRGHALGEPRLLLGVLISTHILGLAFWIGAFAPLVRTAGTQSTALVGALAHDFGVKALWVVGGLVLAGAVMLTLLGAATPSALATPYGQALVLKLLLFAGVLALAAVNKLRLTPALLSASPGAAQRMRRSIQFEAAFVVAILLTTATLTTVATPPRDETQASISSSAIVTTKAYVERTTG